MRYRELEFFRVVRRQTLGLVEGLSQSQIDARPSPAKWSVGEVLDHLHRFDELLRQEISELIELAKAGRRAYLHRSLQDAGVSIPWVPRAFLPLFEIPFVFSNALVPDTLRNAFVRYRVLSLPAPRLARPQPGRPAATLRQELEGFLDQLDALVAAHPDVDLEKLSYYQLAVRQLIQTLEITQMMIP